MERAQRRPPSAPAHTSPPGPPLLLAPTVPGISQHTRPLSAYPQLRPGEQGAGTSWNPYLWLMSGDHVTALCYPLNQDPQKGQRGSSHACRALGTSGTPAGWLSLAQGTSELLRGQVLVPLGPVSWKWLLGSDSSRWGWMSVAFSRGTSRCSQEGPLCREDGRGGVGRGCWQGWFSRGQTRWSPCSPGGRVGSAGSSHSGPEPWKGDSPPICCPATVPLARLPVPRLGHGWEGAPREAPGGLSQHSACIWP